MPLNIGIIGLGIGQSHLEALYTHKQCKIGAICDFEKDKLQEVSARYPGIAQISTKAEELLSNPNLDLIVVASYEEFHAKQTVAALANGKHVFIEKPFCQNLEDAKAIRTALLKNPALKISSNLILRRYPQFIEFKRLIDSKSIGEVYLMEGDYNYGRVEKITAGWRGDQDFYSVMLSGGVHMIDLMLWYANSKVKTVSCVRTKSATRNTKFKFDDTMVALLTFENSAIAKVSANFGCTYPHSHRFSVYGTSGTLENGVMQSLHYQSSDPAVLPREIARGEKPHKGSLALNFVEAIIKKSEPEISHNALFEAVSVGFAIEKAAISQQVEKVQYA